MNRILLAIMILLAYLFMSANISLYNILFGLAAALIIMKMIPARKRTVQVRDIPRGFLALLQYLGLLIKNTIIGGFQVAGMVLSPKMNLKSGVVAVDPDCDHELGQALSAHAISLSPGELLIETDEDGTMFIHSLDVEKTQKVIQQEQKYRRYLLNLIFG